MTEVKAANSYTFFLCLVLRFMMIFIDMTGNGKQSVNLSAFRDKGKKIYIPKKYLLLAAVPPLCHYAWWIGCMLFSCTHQSSSFLYGLQSTVLKIISIKHKNVHLSRHLAKAKCFSEIIFHQHSQNFVQRYFFSSCEVFFQRWRTPWLWTRLGTIRVAVVLQWASRRTMLIT